MFPEWTWIVGLMLGATIGSFLNVVIYRMPRLLSLSDPKYSFCPICKMRLDGADLFPLFSWLTSKGRCRHCDVKIPARYFYVELITGIIWAALWYKFFCADYTGSQWVLGCFYMAASAALVAIIFIDGEHFIIPDEINAFLLILGVGYAVYSRDWTLLWQGYLMGWGIIFGIAFFGRLAFGKDAMGHGDIKMMRGVGALIGPVLCVFDVAIAVVTGLIFGILFIAIQSSRDKKAALAASAEDDVKEATGTEEDDYQPESIKDLLILGFSYLICLDVVAINFPQVYTKMGYPMEDVSVEDDDWEPSLTTIPFGPYLAVGAIACMIFGSYMNDYAAPVLKSLFG